MFARLDSAVVTQGVLLAESQRKTVEHLEGGILKRLLVKPGDRVEAGQVVALLDAHPDRGAAGADRGEPPRPRLRHLAAGGRGGGRAGARSGDGARRRPRRSARRSVAAQQALFDARQRAHVGQIAALRRQIDQLRAQIDGDTAQAPRRRAPARELDRGAGAERRSSSTRARRPRQKLLEIDRTSRCSRASATSSAGWRPRRSRTSPAPRPTSRPLGSSGWSRSASGCPRPAARSRR